MLFLLACDTGPDAPPIPEDAPKVQTMLGEVQGVLFTGEWTSKDCPGRTYPRNLVIAPDHGYAGLDLVSPCPAGATCAWSGMVGFAGVWKIEGRTLQLREIGQPASAVQKDGPHPSELVATNEKKLAEGDCIYEPGLYVPEGYTKEQVTPKVPGT
ncbi:MAG: hypothetical protein ACOZNI_32795 [Myxococcota bacterium]